MLHDDYFFLECINELREKLASGREYDILRAAGIMRGLFLDEHPVVDTVNRQRRLRLTFHYIDFTEAYNSFPVKRGLTALHINPSVFPNFGQGQGVQRKTFFAMPAAYGNGRFFSIHDLLSTCANCFGGVHRGPTKNEIQKAVDDFNRQFSLHELPAAVYATKIILGCLMLTLEKLEAAIKGVHVDQA